MYYKSLASIAVIGLALIAALVSAHLPDQYAKAPSPSTTTSTKTISPKATSLKTISYKTPSPKTTSPKATSLKTPSHKTPSHKKPSHKKPSHKTPSPKTPSHKTPSPKTTSHKTPSPKTTSTKTTSPTTTLYKTTSPKTTSTKTTPPQSTPDVDLADCYHVSSPACDKAYNDALTAFKEENPGYDFNAEPYPDSKRKSNTCQCTGSLLHGGYKGQCKYGDGYGYLDSVCLTGRGMCCTWCCQDGIEGYANNCVPTTQDPNCPGYGPDSRGY